VYSVITIYNRDVEDLIWIQMASASGSHSQESSLKDKDVRVEIFTGLTMKFKT
jgi:hypothetical protein